MAAPAQPSGTVTLVFTDVEGSTRLLQDLGLDAYRDALAEHRHIVREAFGGYGGYEVHYEGDAFFYAFAAAPDAVAAVLEVQERLDAGPIRLRVGIHTGKPERDPPKYVGIDVHRAARIADAGHGGQVLLSAATQALVDAEVTDLGEHRLRDLEAPVRLFQLGGGAFPPLRTLSSTNLPRPASSFLGREGELAEAERLLAGTRLLTVTGPGGTGKTRFAIELGSRQLGRFPDGVFWVPLAALRDSALVLDSVAHALGAKTPLSRHINDRRTLLLLDNLEQVIEAAVELHGLLGACPNLTMLVTSRELLAVDGETELALPPLASDDGVALFCERAGLQTDEIVSELCERLDNLPLAIELAAARTRILSPAQLLDRLGTRLDLLKGGRDADPRQHTLRATIEWSYELLDPGEQRLFACLSVFAGGCTLEAAEEVCNAELDVLQRLRDKSLIRHGDNRYWMLETIRSYAAERLTALPDAERLRRHHADWFAQLARRGRPALEGTREQNAWIARLSPELENIRAALGWTQHHDPELMLGLVGNLGIFLWLTGHVQEGLDWVAAALGADSSAPDALRADALEAGAWLAFYREGASELGREYAGACADLRRQLGDERGLGRALREQAKGTGTNATEIKRTRALLEEAARLARRTEDAWNLAITTNNLGDLAMYEGDYERALSLCGESLELRTSRGDDWGATIAGFNVAQALLRLDRHHEARTQAKKALRLSQKVELLELLGETLVILAATELEQDPECAAYLLGAGEAALEESEEGMAPLEAELHERTTAEVRRRLSRSEFEDARDRGRRASRDEAIELALSLD